jgi:hypothetical protein
MSCLCAQCPKERPSKKKKTVLQTLGVHLHLFLTVSKDYSKVINEDCGTKLEQDFSTVDMSLTTANVCPNCNRDGDSDIKIAIGR